MTKRADQRTNARSRTTVPDGNAGIGRGGEKHTLTTVQKNPN